MGNRKHARWFWLGFCACGLGALALFVGAHRSSSLDRGKPSIPSTRLVKGDTRVPSRRSETKTRATQESHGAETAATSNSPTDISETERAQEEAVGRVLFRQGLQEQVTAIGGALRLKPDQSKRLADAFESRSDDLLRKYAEVMAQAQEGRDIVEPLRAMVALQDEVAALALTPEQLGEYRAFRGQQARENARLYAEIVSARAASALGLQDWQKEPLTKSLAKNYAEAADGFQLRGQMNSREMTERILCEVGSTLTSEQSQKLRDLLGASVSTEGK